jgi:hypothetical protein
VSDAESENWTLPRRFFAGLGEVSSVPGVGKAAPMLLSQVIEQLGVVKNSPEVILTVITVPDTLTDEIQLPD